MLSTRDPGIWYLACIHNLRENARDLRSRVFRSKISKLIKADSFRQSSQRQEGSLLICMQPISNNKTLTSDGGGVWSSPVCSGRLQAFLKKVDEPVQWTRTEIVQSYSDERGQYRDGEDDEGMFHSIWVVVKIMVPFWIPAILRHPIFRVPKKGPHF